MRKEDVAKIVEDLVRITKVAKPPDLFEQDPNVKKAKALLVSFGRPSAPSRPPATGLDDLQAILGPLVDLRPVDASQIALGWDLVDEMLVAREHGLPPELPMVFRY